MNRGGVSITSESRHREFANGATRVLRATTLVIAVSLLASGCGDTAEPTVSEPAAAIRVGAFDFPESELLAEVFAQALELRDIPVERLGRIGSRETVEPALELGLIDVVPEYAGTMLSFVSLGAWEPSADSRQTLVALQATLKPRGMIALDPAAAQNRNALVVTNRFAVEHGVRTVSDLIPLAADLVFGGPRECPERYFCLVGLAEVYGLEFESFIPTPGATVVAEALRADEIDVGLLFSTDPMLVGTDLVVLRDDLRLQPAENIVPVVRREALERWGPEVAEALNAVSSRLDNKSLVALNARALEPDPGLAATVADWLAEF